eukprot:6469993-Ditylum_brightwellii.AAC.1
MGYCGGFLMCCVCGTCRDCGTCCDCGTCGDDCGTCGDGCDGEKEKDSDGEKDGDKDFNVGNRDGEDNFSLFLPCSDVGELLDISLQRRGVSC